MNPSHAALYNVRRDQLRKILEPEAGCLRLAVPELPRLDDLVGLAIDGGHDPDWVLDGDTWNRRIDQFHKETDGGVLFQFFVLPPAGARDGEVCAWRKSNHQIELVKTERLKNVFDRLLDVFSGPLARQQIAAPGVVAASGECVPYNTGEFAGYQHSHERRRDFTASMTKSMKTKKNRTAYGVAIIFTVLSGLY